MPVFFLLIINFIRCLCSYKLPDKRWKDFVLTTFYRYECYEELTIFIRAGDINWSEGSFAQKLIIILIQEYKILQAYDFVSGLLQLEENPVDNKFTQYFEFFLETLINSGNQERKRDDFNIQSSSKKVGFDAFLDISLYSHEKVITERFFTENVNYSKYFILYLVRAGRIIDAVEFAIKNVFHIKNDLQSVDIIQNLVNLVDKLPEPMELAIKSNTDFVKLKNIGDRIAEEAVENPDQELTNARTTLYRTNTLRSLPDVSQDSSHEEIKASPEERVGLNFRKPDGDLEESKDESKIMGKQLEVSNEIEQRSRLEDQSGMAIENSRLDQSEVNNPF